RIYSLLSLQLLHPSSQTHTLSLHDALPIFEPDRPVPRHHEVVVGGMDEEPLHAFAAAVDHRLPPLLVGDGDELAAKAWRGSSSIDRKSTRLNSSHRTISYAVFCLKKKKKPH